MTLQEQFTQASKDVQLLSEKPTNDVLLKLYALYKQATLGNNETEAPTNPFDFVAKAKYQAWMSIKDTEKEDAMQQYIDQVRALIASA